MPKLTASKEFIVGKHNIGYVSSDFTKAFSDTKFDKCPAPVFQKLPRYMSDTEIQSELKPGLCTLGDVVAFMDEAPEECKDGWWNLFYTPNFVVRVDWDGTGWRVGTWKRCGHSWDGSGRVFSPVNLASEAKNSDLESSDTLTLEKAIEIVKENGYQVAKII